MSGIRIRAGLPEDVDAVLAFWAVGAEGTSVSDDPAGVRGLIARDPEALLLAVVPGAGPDAEDRIVGSVIAGWDGWRCHLYRLAVHPEFRRRGIGATLVAAAEARFAAVGGRRGDAMVLDDNATAHRAWTAAGYEREGHWSRWVKPLR